MHVCHHGLPGLFPRLGPIGLLPGLVTKGVRRAVIGVDLHALPIRLGGLAELRDLLRADPLVGRASMILEGAAEVLQDA